MIGQEMAVFGLALQKPGGSRKSIADQSSCFTLTITNLGCMQKWRNGLAAPPGGYPSPFGR